MTKVQSLPPGIHWERALKVPQEANRGRRGQDEKDPGLTVVPLGQCTVTIITIIVVVVVLSLLRQKTTLVDRLLGSRPCFQHRASIQSSEIRDFYLLYMERD